MIDTHATTDRMLSIAEAVQEIQSGHMVILCDDTERENEADLCLSAQFATAENINFIAHQACGLICVALSGERLDALRIPLAESNGKSLQGTGFTASVDALHGTTTGISAYDRATTIRALINPATVADDLAFPGHVFPLRARPGGTLERRGHTEASVDLMRLAGMEPGAVICEILGEDGMAARGADLLAFARRWGIGMLAVDTIARYRRIHRVSLVSETHLPTPEATFKLLHYREIATNLDYLALVLGDIQTPSPTLVRLHSACTTGDIFGSQRCDCQAQMQAALHTISAEGRGVLIYLPQEGRGIGLAGKLQAYRLQEQGYDTIEANEHIGYPADARTYSSAVEVLRDLGVTSVRLMTNNPEKLRAVSEQDIDVQRIPLEMQPTDDNRHYLLTKQRRFGHLLTSLSEVQAAL